MANHYVCMMMVGLMVLEKVELWVSTIIYRDTLKRVLPWISAQFVYASHLHKQNTLNDCHM